MDEQERDLLEKTHSLAKENHKILKELQAARRRAALFKMLYWLIVVIIALVIFYQLYPALEQILEVYGTGSDLLNNIPDISNIKNE